MPVHLSTCDLGQPKGEMLLSLRADALLACRPRVTLIQRITRLCCHLGCLLFVTARISLNERAVSNRRRRR